MFRLWNRGFSGCIREPLYCMIFSMYGMNFQQGMLGMPLSDKPWGFVVIILISLVLSGIVTWFLTRSRMFK